MYTQDELKITAHALEYLLANADLSKLEHLYATTTLGHIQGFIDGEMIMNIWTTEDVKSLVDENDEAKGMSPVTDEEAREVLANTMATARTQHTLNVQCVCSRVISRKWHDLRTSTKTHRPQGCRGRAL